MQCQIEAVKNILDNFEVDYFYYSSRNAILAHSRFFVMSIDRTELS